MDPCFEKDRNRIHIFKEEGIQFDKDLNPDSAIFVVAGFSNFPLLGKRIKHGEKRKNP